MMLDLTFCHNFRRDFQRRNAVIGIISGGLSEERDVSIRSGKQITNALTSLGYATVSIDPMTTPLTPDCCDVAFIALHGKHGEDGSIQSLLEHLNIPFTGSSSSTSALAMNKVYLKHLYNTLDIPNARSHVFSPETLEHSLTYPLVLKPIDGGSSVGVSTADSADQLAHLITSEYDTYRAVLGEEFVSGKEITVGVIDAPKAMPLPILELRPKNAMYDYEAKYTSGMTEFICPAELDKKTTETCQQYAETIHKAIGCKGMSRTDMIVTSTQDIYVLETNTIPGMTQLSDLPAQAKALGLSFEQLVEIILASSASTHA